MRKIKKILFPFNNNLFKNIICCVNLGHINFYCQFLLISFSTYFIFYLNKLEN